MSLFSTSTPAVTSSAGTSSTKDPLPTLLTSPSTTSAITPATFTFGSAFSRLNMEDKNKESEEKAPVPLFKSPRDLQARSPKPGLNAYAFSVPKDEDTPWRKVQWTEARRSSLIQTIGSYRPSSDEVTQARVLLLGPVGSGKSSFISSVQSAFEGRVTNRAMVGSASGSFTKKLQSFTIRGQQREDPTCLVLCDTVGLGSDETSGPTLHDILSVVNGHVPDGHKFRPDQAVTPETDGYLRKPSLASKPQCVVFVVDATKVLTYPKGLRWAFRQLREHISELGVHQVALLTHVDEICVKINQDVSNVYKTGAVKHMMRCAADLLGMPLSSIVPVKNYSSELDVDVNTDVLLLSAVDHILQYVELFLQDYKPPTETY